VPYWIWRVLPSVFPEYLPDRPGEGYARFGFVYESPTESRPIGISLRERPIQMIGLNCATCHVGTVRDASDAPARIILGMPAQQFDLQGYLRFLFACARDERFNADTLLPAIRDENPDFSWLDRLFYRYFVIPRTRDALRDEADELSWMDSRPLQGPGRVDTFNPYKHTFFDFDMAADDTVGTADLPALWNQRVRQDLWLHWDGNNDSLDERNRSAALGAGASEDSIDEEALQRVVDWILDLPPPAFPADKIDGSLVEAGRQVYEAECAGCHSLEGQDIGQVTPILEIGTDPERLESFTPELAEEMNTLGSGKPWEFSHFRKTDGYASMLLDGIWLRGPYLHNGSVPTLRDLLNPLEERPVVFYRGYDVYDYENVGFVTSGPEAERLGFRFDTRERGNGNQGHTYGTELSEAEKDAVIEFLKTQ
jgi:mono/diheme cytochrome c family protein